MPPGKRNTTPDFRPVTAVYFSQTGIYGELSRFTVAKISFPTVSAITSPDRTGAKVYYQSGPDWYW